MRVRTRSRRKMFVAAPRINTDWLNPAPDVLFVSALLLSSTSVPFTTSYLKASPEFDFTDKPFSVTVVPLLTNTLRLPLEVLPRLPVTVTLPPPLKFRSLPQLPTVIEAIVTGRPGRQCVEIEAGKWGVLTVSPQVDGSQ